MGSGREFLSRLCDVMLDLLDQIRFPKPDPKLPDTFLLIESVADLERVGNEFRIACETSRIVVKLRL